MTRCQFSLVTIAIAATLAWGQNPPPTNTPAAGQQPLATQSSPSTPQSGPGAGSQTPNQPQSTQPATGASGAASQTGAPAAASGQNTISGCMQRGFAYYQVSDPATSKVYEIRGNGVSLTNFENHVVQIQGIADPKDSQPNHSIFYVQKVQDSGQTCGPAGQAAAAAGAPATGTAAGNTSGAGTTAGATPGTLTPGTASPQGTQPSGVASPAGSANSPGQTPTGNASPQASQQSGTAGATTGTSSSTQASPTQQSSGQPSGEMESKGTPQAGTPQQGSVSGPASSSSTTSTSSQPRSGAKTFQGCLSGDPNNLMLTANGTSYSLQGNTRSLGTMINHQVEVTGDDRNGKAIEVTGARDLGTACSAK